MTQETEHIGEKVREAREMRGWTQAELAERLGIDHTGVSHLEAGRTDNPTLKRIRRLADALDVTVKWLLDE